jgi:acid stress-induced BolA-like protein IbaG/YrbA
MELKNKIMTALSRFLKIEYIRLEGDGEISGFVVSPTFQGMSSMDRQELIDKALYGCADALTPQERHRVLMIAGLTPQEYQSVGPRVRIHRVREMAGGDIEVLLHGGPSDADYVRGVLKHQKGIRTSEPKQISGAIGILMSFRAKGTEAAPLTKARVFRVLRHDPYIEVMPNS